MAALVDLMNDHGRLRAADALDERAIDAEAFQVADDPRAGVVVAHAGHGQGAPAEPGEDGQHVAARAAGLGAERLAGPPDHVQPEPTHADDQGSHSASRSVASASGATRTGTLNVVWQRLQAVASLESSALLEA